MSRVLRLIAMVSTLLLCEVAGAQEFGSSRERSIAFRNAERLFRQGRVDQACQILRDLSAPTGGNAICRYEYLCYWALIASAPGSGLQNRSDTLAQITDALAAIVGVQETERKAVRDAKAGPYDLRHLQCRRACVALALSCGDLQSAKRHTAIATQVAVGSDLALPADQTDTLALRKQLIEWLIGWNLSLGEADAAESVAKKHMELGGQAGRANDRFREVLVLLRLGERSQTEVEDHMASHFYRKAATLLASIKPSKDEEAQYTELVGWSSCFFQGRAMWSSGIPSLADRPDELDAASALKLMTRWGEALVSGDAAKAMGCILPGNEGIEADTRYWLDKRPKTLTFSSPVPAGGPTANLAPGKVGFEFTIVVVDPTGKKEEGSQLFLFVRDGDNWRIRK